jgi:hypothetical protein
VPGRGLQHPRRGKRHEQRVIRTAATPPRRTAVLGAVAGALALSVTALGAVGAWPGAGNAPTTSPGFRITGSADGLLPGVPGRLTVTVRNPYRFAIRVTAIRASARDAGACRGRNLTPARLRRPFVVPARATRRVVLPISLAANAPNECQRATFRLAFSGRAVKA